MTGGVINTDADYMNGVFLYGDNGEKYRIDDVAFNCAGLGGNDFGKNGAWGATISVAGNMQVETTGLVVNTKGPLHDGIWAGGSSIVNVNGVDGMRSMLASHCCVLSTAGSTVENERLAFSIYRDGSKSSTPM